MEFDVEVDETKAAAIYTLVFDRSIIPNIVDGSGDTPDPNHKKRLVEPSSPPRFYLV